MTPSTAENLTAIAISAERLAAQRNRYREALRLLAAEDSFANEATRRFVMRVLAMKG